MAGGAAMLTRVLFWVPGADEACAAAIISERGA